MSVEGLLALIKKSPGAGFKKIIRRLPDGQVTFFANYSAVRFDGWDSLKSNPQSGLLMDPRTGKVTTAALRVKTKQETRLLDDMTEVYLQLEPGESIFVRTFNDRVVEAPAGPSYWRDAGPATPLTTPWRVTFTAGGPALPPAFTTPTLTSWTAQGGEAERFAGTARYETEFDLSELGGRVSRPVGSTSFSETETGQETRPPVGAPDDWRLDLGDVRETARVFVNGREVDLLWSLPFRTRIGAFLKPGKNTLAIEVTNLAANRIRDLDQRKVAWKNFHEINFVNIDYKPFDASAWPLQPSGLLGPVTLTPLKAFNPSARSPP